MSNIEKIGKAEVIALFITIISNNIIINISSILLNTSSTGSWVNIIYLTVICLAFILLICKFFKPFINSDILDVADFLGGKLLKIIIAFLYIILFFSFSALCLRYFANSLNIIYFNNTPLAIIILLLLVPAAIASKAGLKAVSGSNIIFVPITVISLIVFFIAASNNFVWQNLFPSLRLWCKTCFFNRCNKHIYF